MSGGKSTPARRILAKFGESDEFLGFTIADLKLLVPTVFLGVIIAGKMPPAFQPLGWVLGGGLVLSSVVAIYASPHYQTVIAWLRDKAGHILGPTHRRLDVDTAATDDADRHRPETPGHQESPETDDTAESTQSLTEIKRFHMDVDAGERSDECLFGALRIEPANMALATDADWKHAVESFGTAVNSIQFPFQIYSTVTTVSPERVCAGYHDRLNDDCLSETPEFRELVETYTEAFPQEFTQRGTTVREYYAIVPVSPLDVQSQGSSLGEDSLLEQLGTLDHVGGFFRTLGAYREFESPEERRARQLAELDRRLEALAEGIRGINGCSTERLETDELAAVIDEYWAGSSTESAPDRIVPRTTPIVAADQEDPR